MKNIRTVNVLLIAALVPAIALLRCANPSSGGTETGDGRVTAMLYNPGGTPAASAKVCFYRHGDDPRNNHAVDSTYADNNGNYSKNLDTGTYNILATLGTNATFQDSVVVIEHDTTRPPPDTLKTPGGIKGIVQLEEGGDPTTVFVLFMGANVFTTVQDAAGNFASGSIAKGRYQVKFLTTLDNYKPKDTVLSVTAGTVDSLQQPIILQYTGIPTPTGLAIIYDTLRQIVNLRWNKPATGRPLNGYNIYRKHQDSALVLLRADWQDTVYHDSTGIQDITYEYRVAAVDTNTTEGTKSAGVSVVIASYFVLDSTFGTTGSGQGQFDYPSDIAIAANGDIYIVDNYNNRIQVFDSTMLYKRQFGNGILNGPNFISIDNIGQTFVAEYNKIFVFNATDTLVDTITAAQGIYDLDAKDSTLYVITNGDSISLYSYDGTKKRSWECGVFNSCFGIATGDSGKVFVSNSDQIKVMVYDTLGNFLSAITTPLYPSSIVADEVKHRLYTVCVDDIHGDMLYVTDLTNAAVAIYKIPNTPTQISEGASIGLEKNGTVFLVRGSSNKILKLKSLLP
jgi:hypothetical protein